MQNKLDVFEKINYRFYNSLYTMSIAKEAASSDNSNGGIIIIGMVIVIVGLIGFILTKNKN